MTDSFIGLEPNLESAWDFRVIAYPNSRDESDSQDTYLKVEAVRYSETGRPIMHWSFDPSGYCLAHLALGIDRMRDALAKPAMWGDSRFPEEYTYPNC